VIRPDRPSQDAALDRLLPLLAGPLHIRDKTIPSRLMLAPMSKLTHAALRTVITSYGPRQALLWTGMCGANALPTLRPEDSVSFSWNPEELSLLVCQIFGSEPQAMARAARRIQELGFFGLDLNMGCSVARICRHGAGADLLRHPERALRIVEAVRQSISIPLFVKYRTGWSPDPEPAPAFGRQLENAGADCLVFHPRVAPDRRTRPPVWEHIGRLKESVSIPVIGNGNVFSAADCLRMLQQTGCDGVSLGRLAVARPWVFALWTLKADPGPNPWLDSAVRLFQAACRYFPPQTALRVLHGHAPYLAADFAFGRQILTELRATRSLEEFRTCLLRTLDPLPRRSLRPSSFLFTM
jgi:nifR3 family TIM-barrel protein